MLKKARTIKARASDIYIQANGSDIFNYTFTKRRSLRYSMINQGKEPANPLGSFFVVANLIGL
ncbi:hypothetical protein CF651_06935 [Paenibacillus rigui]|uniref:Uncharacterized protein n=1 Tax=Paenibacillus rigui TaxID=554312 RepID=A0A229UU44_9BACL|nr:hypothetical protein CF651_06935 [Paenibacillus rigui]